MPHTAYPTAAEIEAYLRGLGLMTEEELQAFLDGVDLESVAEGIKSAWETDTGWIPFLRDPAPVARRFQPPGPNHLGFTRGAGSRLELSAGLLELVEIRTGYSSSDPGDVVLLEDDYWLWPTNAAIEGRPFTVIDFPRFHFGRPESIRITGYWGFGAFIPADAWQAMLGAASASLFTALGLRASGGMEMWAEADIIEKSALGGAGTRSQGGQSQDPVSRWLEQWMRAVRRYRRPYL